jgi:hypothetical protein
MHYMDGQLIRRGDRVRLWAGAEGVVVCSLDTGEYSDGYPASEWCYLKSGILVLSPQIGLIHYINSEASLTRLA